VLGIVYLLTMEIGLLTPPFGLLMFVMRGVAPAEISMRQIYAAVVPFLAIKLFVLGLIGLAPRIGTWLPGLMGG
jgi:TRAP-type C4-dicarboxylate transport system permease large subunit